MLLQWVIFGQVSRRTLTASGQYWAGARRLQAAAGALWRRLGNLLARDSVADAPVAHVWVLHRLLALRPVMSSCVGHTPRE